MRRNQNKLWIRVGVAFVVIGTLAYSGINNIDVSTDSGESDAQVDGAVDGISEGDGSAEGVAKPALRQGAVGAISSKCIECHKDVAEKWQHSHHGLANRMVSKERDGEVFAGQSIDVPGESWTMNWGEGKEQPSAAVKFADKEDEHNYPMAMAIGEMPLIQYLTDGGDGRWQTSRIAWDPVEKEWFDTTPGDDRTRLDWGHWTGRGMNWNANCAYCHMTAYNKNYDVKTDVYHSRWDEMAIGCTQCHGDLLPVANPDNGCLVDIDGDPMSQSDKVTMDSCASCHSRRGEIDDAFVAGAAYEDHYQLTLPNTPGLWYADGQILGEDYVWTSFKMSKMGHAGVTCMDCHDPHTAAVKFPVENNALCMQCHGAGINGASMINPTEHSFHGAESTGNRCVECHMTNTTYMGRDPRRDHGFHIPDPLLTKELGIPNACNKCHTDQSVDWAIKWVDEWYGEKMNRPERERTRLMQAAYNGDPAAIDGLIKVYDKQEIPAWRATLLGTMQAWAADPRVVERADAAMDSETALVREAAAGVFARNRDVARLQKVLDDPVRSVRITAAWALINQLPEDSDAYKEVDAFVTHISDQPAGALRRAEMLTRRGDFDSAAEWYKKAVDWDASSAATHEAYAIFLNQTGKRREAVAELFKAANMEPQNGRYPYLLGLAYGELKEQEKARESFTRAVELAPGFARAHYNLGLLLAAEEKLDEAAASILRAEAADPSLPDYPYARATIHLRQRNTEASMEAATKALGIDRNYQPAIGLIRQLMMEQRRQEQGEGD